VGFEKVRALESGADRFQALNVFGLRVGRNRTVSSSEKISKFDFTHHNLGVAIDKVLEGQDDLVSRLGGLEIFRTGAVTFFDSLSK
jgi:hypothetical protein